MSSLLPLTIQNRWFYATIWNGSRLTDYKEPPGLIYYARISADFPPTMPDSKSSPTGIFYKVLLIPAAKSSAKSYPIREITGATWAQISNIITASKDENTDQIVYINGPTATRKLSNWMEKAGDAIVDSLVEQPSRRGKREKTTKYGRIGKELVFSDGKRERMEDKEVVSPDTEITSKNIPPERLVNIKGWNTFPDPDPTLAKRLVPLTRFDIEKYLAERLKAMEKDRESLRFPDEKGNIIEVDEELARLAADNPYLRFDSFLNGENKTFIDDDVLTQAIRKAIERSVVDAEQNPKDGIERSTSQAAPTENPPAPRPGSVYVSFNGFERLIFLDTWFYAYAQESNIFFERGDLVYAKLTSDSTLYITTPASLEANRREIFYSLPFGLWQTFILNRRPIIGPCMFANAKTVDKVSYLSRVDSVLTDQALARFIALKNIVEVKPEKPPRRSDTLTVDVPPGPDQRVKGFREL